MGYRNTNYPPSPPPPKKKLRPNSLTKQEKELKSLLRMFLQVQYFDHKEPSSQVSRHLYGGLMKLLKIKKKPNVRINQNVDNDSNICSRRDKNQANLREKKVEIFKIGIIFEYLYIYI